MKKILITGSGGFIGKNLYEFLKRDYAICAPSHKELDLLNSQAVETYLKKEQFDVVIHSAIQGTLGLPEECERKVLKNNLRMFFNLERCHGEYDKMYYIGSGAEYGKEAYIPDMKEEYFDHTVPVDDYGLSKYAMAKTIKGTDNICDLRVFGIFGPYENYNYRFISNVICKALKNQDICIHKNVFFDYIYIKDFCHIMKWFLENNPKNQYYNVCTGRAVDIYSIAKNVVSLTESKSRIVVEQEGLGREYSGNNGRLMQEMGEFEFTGLDTALEELIEYYKGISYKLSGDY